MVPEREPLDHSEMTWLVQKQMAKYKHENHRRLRLEHTLFDATASSPYLSMQISSQEILEVDDARNLLVDFVEELLKAINLDPLIASQLTTVPFTADQLHIEINFESYLGLFIDPFYIGCVELEHGMAHYLAFDVKNQRNYDFYSRVEPYETSREVSFLSRAAEKEFFAEHPCPIPPIAGQYIPPDNPDCHYYRKF
jgi:hypothetical protein